MNGCPVWRSRSGAPSAVDGWNMSKRKTKTYDMKFVPLDANGKLKKNCPFVGEERGYEIGEIVSLPIEKRWETWWELVDPDVPKTVLDRDQKKRDAFMVKAELSAKARAEELKADERLTKARRY